MRELSIIGTEKDCPVAVLVRGGRMLVGLRHYTPDKWENVTVWTLPGGRCDAGETLEKALRREAGEEIGVDDLRIAAFIGTVEGAKEGDVVHLFLAETAQEPRNMEPKKFSKWEWIAPDAMPPNFINPAALAAIRAYLAGADAPPA